MSHQLNDISSDEVSRQILELGNLDYANASIDEIKDKISTLMNGYSAITRIINSQYAWRVRRNKDDNYFLDMKELWYPKPELILKYGRLNRPNKSLMYIAASHESALLEMRPKPGERFTILQIKLRDTKKTPHVMELGVAERSSQFDVKTSVKLLENTLQGSEFLNGEKATFNNLAIRSFLGREFTKIVERGNEEEFKVSVAISEILMSSPKIDGVEYPCMAGDTSKYLGAANMALKPESADRLFMPDICWLSEVLEELGPQHLVSKFAAFNGRKLFHLKGK